MSDPLHIWCDGSYRQEYRTMGAAWVRAAKDASLAPEQASVPLPLLKHAHAHGSDIAELTAFALALEAAPVSPKVEVHMDCANVITWLSEGRVSTKTKACEPEIMKAFGRAMAAKGRMKTVAIVKTSDKNSPNMALAHQLSRAASTPGDAKTQKRKSHAHQDSRRPARTRNP